MVRVPGVARQNRSVSQAQSSTGRHPPELIVWGSCPRRSKITLGFTLLYLGFGDVLRLPLISATEPASAWRHPVLGAVALAVRTYRQRNPI